MLVSSRRGSENGPPCLELSRHQRTGALDPLSRLLLRPPRSRLEPVVTVGEVALDEGDHPPPEPESDPEPGGGCEPGYDPCVPVYPPDVNCPDVNGPIPVTGSDPHGLDGDGDGVACEDP